MRTCPARILRVFVCPRDRRKGIVNIGVFRFPCALGRSGAGLKKREGDGFTPVGIYGLRRLHYRPDKFMSVRTNLPKRAMTRADWWSDDPEDRDYNRLVRQRAIPRGSKEGLWRKDSLYDLV
ncbi:MAG: L,D-transpeptidase family protein, partial [Pseudomonadota bacterium]